MKKLLSLLATVSLASTATASIVACGNGNNDPIDEDNGDNINQDISTIILVTNLGDINFYSLTGNDVQTQTEIINQVRALNSNVGDAQINISNIIQLNGTATISVVGFNGSLTITFTPRLIEAEQMPISFTSSLWSSIQLQDGTILVIGGTTTNGSNSFLASVDLYNPQIHTLVEGSTNAFPSSPRSIIELQDGTILVAGGVNAASSFLASVDLSDPANPQTQTLAQGSTAFPSGINSITELQDGTILAAGGADAASSFLSSVDLSDPANPQTQILAQGSTAFPSNLQSLIELQDGTILVVGGNVATGTGAFLASVDLSDPDNPQIQTLAQDSDAFPSIPRSIIELQDGTIFVAGGTVANGSNSFLASVDLSNSEIQILAQGSTAFPSSPRSIIELQDGTILVAGGTAANGSNSFLRVI